MSPILQRFLRRFAMTNEERLLVIGILTIALIGSVARYWHLHQKAVPPGLEQEER